MSAIYSCWVFIDYEIVFDSIELWAVKDVLVNSHINSRWRNNAQ